MKLPTSAPILKEEDDKKDEEKKGKVKNLGERERIKKERYNNKISIFCLF